MLRILQSSVRRSIYDVELSLINAVILSKTDHNAEIADLKP